MCTLSDSQANLLRVVLNHKPLNKCQDFSRFETDIELGKRTFLKIWQEFNFFFSRQINCLDMDF